jgi:hypothetical protein
MAHANWLVSQKLPQLFAGGIGSAVGLRLGNPVPPGKIKILAKVPTVFVQYGFCPAFPALLGDTGIIKGAIQAHAQVRPALHAGFAPAGQAAQGPRFAAFMTMSSHPAILVCSGPFVE